MKRVIIFIVLNVINFSFWNFLFFWPRSWLYDGESFTMRLLLWGCFFSTLWFIYFKLFPEDLEPIDDSGIVDEDEPTPSTDLG